MGLPIALCFFLFFGASSQVQAAPILSFTVPNYSECDIQVGVRIDCGGVISEYRGKLGTGAATAPSSGLVKLFSGPAYDPDLQPSCTITIAVKIIGGQLFTATGNTATGFSFQYCCTDGVPNGCSNPDNCTTIGWNHLAQQLFAAPGC